MSIMIEVLYRIPIDLGREQRIVEIVESHGGKQTFREEPTNESKSQSVCLTFEFSEASDADFAVKDLYQHGIHVEGPMDYGGN